MKYELVENDNGHWSVTEFELETFIAEMKARGFEHMGETRRKAFAGHPVFRDVPGPMWGGEGLIRYETKAACEALSI